MIAALALALVQITVPDSGTVALLAALRAARREPVPFLIEALRRHRVVFLGDVHPAAEPKRLLVRLIEAQAASPILGALALEIGQDQQAVIDRYLASQPEDTTILLDHPVTVRVQWGAAPAYLAVYRAVWRHNHGAGRDRPIAVIAADVPGWPIPALTPGMAVQAFATRDPWIAATLDRTLSRLDGETRVLAFFGGYHGLKRVGGRVAIGRARMRLDGWAAGLLADRGVDVYSVFTDGAAPGGGLEDGATRLYRLVAGAADLAAPFAAALDSSVDAVVEPLRPIVGDDDGLEFVPARFSLREAVDAYLFLGNLSVVAR